MSPGRVWLGRENGGEVGDGRGINADYTAHCETKAGDSLLGLVMESVKYCKPFLCLYVNTIWCM